MRTSGVVMPIFSLPSDFGIGTLGRDACDFIDFLASADVHVWEIMPICHTDSSFSPHNALCARAGNPLLIDLQPFVDQGVFSSRELSRMDWGRDRAKISYSKVAAAKYKALEMVFDALGSLPDSSFDRFQEESIRSITVSGIRCQDMRLRMKYVDIPTMLEADVEKAIRSRVADGTGNLYVLVNYTALFSTRNILKKLEGEQK